MVYDLEIIPFLARASTILVERLAKVGKQLSQLTRQFRAECKSTSNYT